ncbi:MAG: hypothetical protein ACOZE5_18840 [Verrucomicrobiota bacterium]
MDESLRELENELKRLTPRGPSPALRTALERELGPAAPAPAVTSVRRYVTATSLRSWKWASWTLAGTGVAAVVALLVFLQTDHRPAGGPDSRAAPTPAAEQAHAAAVAANRYEPVQVTSVLYDLQEGDPATLPDRTAGREVRYRYVDTYTWKNPATNASLRWSVPRDEVRLVRTNFN